MSEKAPLDERLLESVLPHQRTASFVQGKQQPESVTTDLCRDYEVYLIFAGNNMDFISFRNCQAMNLARWQCIVAFFVKTSYSCARRLWRC